MSSDQVKTVFKHNLTNLYIVKLDCPSNKVFAWDSELSCGGGKKCFLLWDKKNVSTANLTSGNQRLSAAISI